MNESNQEKAHTHTFPKLPETNLEKIVGYDVIDKIDNNIGDVTAIWTDHAGQPAYIGVKTNWLLGKTHVVPTYGAQVNHQRGNVRIAYSSEDVKNAPNYDPDAQMDLAHEREVHNYYYTRGPRLPEFETGTASREMESRRPQPPQGETTIPLHEEHLKVGKRNVEAGGIRLRKIVRTETVQQPVNVTREDIVVERVPAGQRTGREREPAGKAFAGEDIYIPLRREEPVVEKESVVREEVHARKRSETERETVSGTVRKEDVEIEDQRHAERERGH